MDKFEYRLLEKAFIEVNIVISAFIDDGPVDIILNCEYNTIIILYVRTII